MEWKTDSDIDDMDDETYSPFAKKKSSRLFERTETPFILVGAVLIVLIVFFIFFIPKTQKGNFEDLKAIESRLSAIEQRMGQLEKIKQPTGGAEVQVQGNTINPLEYQQLVNWIKSNGEIISKIITKIDGIQQELNRLNKNEKAVVTQSKPKLQPQPKSKPKPQPKAKPQAKIEPKPKPISKSEPETPVKPETKPQVKPETEPVAQVKTAPQKPEAVAETLKMTYHTVKKGETLYRISRKYGTSVKKIQDLNNMKNSLLIYPGQELVVRAEKQ